MSAINFVRHSDCRWLLLAPPVDWLAGLALHVAQRGHHRV